MTEEQSEKKSANWWTLGGTAILSIAIFVLLLLRIENEDWDEARVRAAIISLSALYMLFVQTTEVIKDGFGSDLSRKMTQVLCIVVDIAFVVLVVAFAVCKQWNLVLLLPLAAPLLMLWAKQIESTALRIVLFVLALVCVLFGLIPSLL